MVDFLRGVQAFVLKSLCVAGWRVPQLLRTKDHVCVNVSSANVLVQHVPPRMGDTPPIPSHDKGGKSCLVLFQALWL